MLSFPIEDEFDRSGRSPDEGGTGPASIEADTGRQLLLGDVVICPVVAAANAVDHGVTFDDEIALLVVHGILHLLGMDHEHRRGGRADGTARAAAARPFPPRPAAHRSGPLNRP